MSFRGIFVGLDIGTGNIRAVVGQKKINEIKPQILGAAQVSSTGVRKGSVVDSEDVVDNICKVVKDLEMISGFPVDHVFVNVSGVKITSNASKGVVAVSRADGQISEEDINRVLNAAQAISMPANREILHVVPRQFWVDSEECVKNPIGMSGVRLEVDALVVLGASPFIKELVQTVNKSQLEIDGLVLSGLAASKAVLTKQQKELGVVLIDIGAGITSIAVFEEGDLVHACDLPVGSGHITNDIAIGLRTSIDLAEMIKLQYGFALPNEIARKEGINLSKFNLGESGVISRREVSHIIEARLQEIFEVVNKELKKINRQGLLPAGAVLTGGGAKVPGIVDLAKDVLKLPVQVGFPLNIDGVIDKVDEPAFATAIGLMLWGMGMAGKHTGNRLPNWIKFPIVEKTVGRVKRVFKTFLP